MKKKKKEHEKKKPVDTFGFQGIAEIVLTDKNGNVKDREVVKNKIVNDGYNLICDLMIGAASKSFGFMEIGTGTNTPDIIDSSLQAPVAGGKVQCDSTANLDGKTVRFIASWGDGIAEGDITEAGIFTSDAEGDIMFNRLVFQAKPKGPGDSLSLTWTIALAGT